MARVVNDKLPRLGELTGPVGQKWLLDALLGHKRLVRSLLGQKRLLRALLGQKRLSLMRSRDPFRPSKN